ncbi:hypothetical protein NSA53_06675 [Cellulosimicrobium cellulans]|nr:hypothetical protein [Sphaerisporangium cinnabarinum]MCR1981929.1 hypothetical protein [Cellulosimicrobium cellulans]
MFDVTFARHAANAHERATRGPVAVTRVTAVPGIGTLPVAADGTLGP